MKKEPQHSLGRHQAARSSPAKEAEERRGVRRTLRALGRLARARGRVKHVPTRTEVRAMAYFDGREPSSYPLDPGAVRRCGRREI